MMPKIQVDFRLIGTGILPDEITRLSDIHAAKTWLAGDLVPPIKFRRKEIRRKENGWLLAVRDLEETYEINHFFFQLLDILLPKSEIFVEICEKYEMHSEFSAAVYITDETPSINFDQRIISGLEELKTTVDIDLILVAP